jgi:hypothetical protein
VAQQKKPNRYDDWGAIAYPRPFSGMFSVAHNPVTNHHKMVLGEPLETVNTIKNRQFSQKK